MLHSSKTILINVIMEAQDAGVVDPRLQHGALQCSQKALSLAGRLLGHSMPLPCL